MGLGTVVLHTSGAAAKLHAILIACIVPFITGAVCTVRKALANGTTWAAHQELDVGYLAAEGLVQLLLLSCRDVLAESYQPTHVTHSVTLCSSCCCSP